MFTIVGLGNPGSKYAQTRHNIGFWVVAEIVKQVSEEGGVLNWQNKFSCKFVKGQAFGASVLFVLPQKYMNCSGEALGPICAYYKIQPEELVIIHDDLDLDPGVVRFKRGGGSAGHRGIEDIRRVFGDKDWVRVRVGVGHPRRLKEGGEQESGLKKVFKQLFLITSPPEMDVTSWVLGCARGEELDLLCEGVKKAAYGVELLVKQGLEAAQNEIHTKA